MAVGKNLVIDSRFKRVTVVGVANQDRLLWSGSFVIDSKQSISPYDVKITIKNDSLGISETLTMSNLVGFGSAFGGPVFVNGTEQPCGKFNRPVPDGEFIALDVAAEVTRTGSEALRSSVSQPKGLSKVKFTSGFSQNEGSDDRSDRGSTTFILKSPKATEQTYSTMLINDPASGRSQAVLTFVGAWPSTVGLRGDWRSQQVVFGQYPGTAKVVCEKHG
jgi:hypothetical protein